MPCAHLSNGADHNLFRSLICAPIISHWAAVPWGQRPRAVHVCISRTSRKAKHRLSVQDVLMELSGTPHGPLVQLLFPSLAFYVPGLTVLGGSSLHLAQVKDQGWCLWVQRETTWLHL